MVSKYYPPDPSKIVDFATGLKEVYEEQDKSWATREAQDQVNDQRRIEYSGDTLKALESGFDFLGTVGRAFVTDKKKKEADDKLKQQMGSLTWNPDNQETYNKIAEYRREKKEILQDDEEWSGLLAKLDPNTKAFLLEMSPKEALYAQEFFAHKTIQSLPGSFNKKLAEDRDFAVGYQEAIKKGPENQRAFIRNYANGQFGTNRPSDGLLFESVVDALDKWEATEGILSLGKAIKINHANDAIKREEQYTQIIKSGNVKQLAPRIQHDIVTRAKLQTINGKPLTSFTSEDFKQEFENNTDIQRATLETFEELNALAFDGKFTQSEVETFFDTFIDHPAGDTIKAFLDKEGITEARLKENARIGAQRAIDIHDASLKTETANIAKETLVQMQENYDKDFLQSRIDLIESKGGANLPEMRALRAMLTSNQAPGEAEEVLKTWEKKFKTVDITKLEEEIKDEPNNQVRQVLLKRLEKIKEARKTYGYNDKFTIGFLDKAKRYKTADGQEVLTGSGGTLHTHINTMLANSFEKYVNLKHENPYEAAMGDVKKWVAAEKEKGKNGLLHYDSRRQEYTNWEAQQEKSVQKETIRVTSNALGDQAKRNPTKAQINLWETELSKIDFNKDNPGALEDILLEQPILSETDILGVLNSGQYSAETKYKASALGIPPGTLVEAQVRYMLKQAQAVDSEDQLVDPLLADFVEKYGLDKFEIPENDVDFWSALNEDKIMSAHAKQQGGFENLSSNMQTRAALFGQMNNLEVVNYIWPGGGGIPTRLEGYTPTYSGEILDTATSNQAKAQKAKEEALAKAKAEKERREKEKQIMEGINEIEQERRGSLQN